MARIGGRNSVMAWIVGLGCTAVLAVLVLMAMPAIPGAVHLVGDTLRLANAPRESPTPRANVLESSTPECRDLYSEPLWSELTQRAGGDPAGEVPDASATAQSLAAALTPEVRATCAFTGTSTGSIVTAVSEVSAGATGVARSALEADGFACTVYGDGVRCTRETAEATEEHAVRAGVWVSNVFTGWQPSRYIERIAPQLWGE